MADSLPPTSFQRSIYWVYYRGSACQHILFRLIRPAGLLVLFFLPLPWFILALHNNSSIWQLRVLLFTLPLVSFTWLLFRRGSVQVTREIPRLATAGEPLHYSISVKNTGKSTLRGVTLLEEAPDNRPSLLTFCHAREPYEDSRNAFDQKFCYYRWLWLQQQQTLFHSKETKALAPIKSGESSQRIKHSLTPSKRGVTELTKIRLCLQDPLGLFQLSKKMPSSQDKVIILPKRYRVPELTLLGDARFQQGGDTASRSIGQSGDFTSTRDYAPGDAIKDIHWKSWARTGKPIVKEYEDVLFPRYGLVLDTYAAPHQSAIFEDAVSIAASFAASLDTQTSMLDLMFINNEAFTFSAGHGEDKVDTMLEILASVSSTMEHQFSQLEKLITRHKEELSACICIFTDWCEERAHMLSRLHHSGQNLYVIISSYDIDLAKEKLATHPAPVGIHWLRHQHLQQDLERLSAR